MRKTVKGQTDETQPFTGGRWLDLEQAAQVEVTSEAVDHPIEEALVSRSWRGWRAAGPGEQTILLRFDEPQTISHIRLVFEEKEQSRTQEVLLRWSADDGRTFREIVRQQYHFAPSGNSREIEDYRVELERLTVLELQIRPEIGGDNAVASLKELCLA